MTSYFSAVTMVCMCMMLQLSHCPYYVPKMYELYDVSCGSIKLLYKHLCICWCKVWKMACNETDCVDANNDFSRQTETLKADLQDYKNEIKKLSIHHLNF